MRHVLILLSLSCAFAADLSFKAQTIADDLRGGYQIVITDLNHDGKPDLLALASGLDALVWYENPSWTRHVIARGLNRMINCAVLSDDIVVAHGFDSDALKSVGTSRFSTAPEMQKTSGASERSTGSRPRTRESPNSTAAKSSSTPR